MATELEQSMAMQLSTAHSENAELKRYIGELEGELDDRDRLIEALEASLRHKQSTIDKVVQLLKPTAVSAAPPTAIDSSPSVRESG